MVFVVLFFDIHFEIITLMILFSAHNIPVIPPLYPMYDTTGAEFKADVQLLDLKPCYEKGQSRRKANSEQRLLDAEVHMVAEFERPLQVGGSSLYSGSLTWPERFTTITCLPNVKS